MSEDVNKRNLRSLLTGYSAKPGDDVQKRQDAQLTQYEVGSGEGIQEIREQLKKDPNNETLRDWLAFSLYSNDDVDEAVQQYMFLIKMNPQKLTYHYYLANCFAKKGSIQKAVAEWQIVVRADPYSKMGRKAQARVDQAKQLLERVAKK
jgi:tetratricopeptide (TPR) repeat protein